MDAKAGALKARVTDGRTAGSRTFLVSRGLYVGASQRAKAGPGDSSVGLLSSGTRGRPIYRSRGVTPSSVVDSWRAFSVKPW